MALAIPLSMLFAANLMLATGVTASLMSLGAIDFGLIVDSSVIMIENCVRRLAHDGGTRPKLEIIRDAAVEVRKPTMFGELIIAIVYLPILALQGTEGKLFRPMALTVIFALAGSMVLSLTLMPVLASLGLSAKARGEGGLARSAGSSGSTSRSLDAVIRRPVIAAPAGARPGGRRACRWRCGLGGEFMPRLDEGDLLIEAVRIPSASLEGAVADVDADREHPQEVPRGPHGLLQDRPARDRQRRDGGASDRRLDHAQAAGRVAAGPDPRRPDRGDGPGAAPRTSPGVKFGFSQPIEMRVNELVAGVKSDVAVLLYGPDLDVLRQKAGEIERVLARVPGATDVKTPTSGRLPMLRISVRRDQLARYGIKAADVLDAVAALGGTTVGTVFEGQVRHADPGPPPRVLAERPREDPLDPRSPTPRAGRSRSRDLADVALRGRARARSSARTSSAGRWSASTSGAATSPASSPRPRRRSQAKVELPPGYLLRWGGQFEHLQTATRRLMIVVPIALALIFLLLFSTFQLAAAGRPDLPGRADGGDRRGLRAGRPRAAVLDLGGGRLHRPVRRGGAQRPGLGQRRRAPAPRGVEPHEAAREAADASGSGRS